SPLADRLRELQLTANSVSTRGVRALAASPRLRYLTTLMVQGRGLRVDAVRGLLESPYLPELTLVCLDGLNVRAPAVQKLLLGSAPPRCVVCFEPSPWAPGRSSDQELRAAYEARFGPARALFNLLDR